MAKLSQDSEIGEAILEELARGARTKGYLVDETGYHRNTIGQHLKMLLSAEKVECIHEPTALYRLAESRDDNS